MSAKLAGKSVAYIFKDTIPDDYLTANLKSFGMDVVDDAGDVDIIICAINSISWDDLPEEGPGRPAVVGWIAEGVDFRLDSVLACGLDCILSAQMTLAEQRLALLVGLQNLELNKRLRDRLLKVTEQLRAASVIEKAKIILTNKNGVSDLESYKLLREQAMNKRLTVSELANSIVEAHDILS